MTAPLPSLVPPSARGVLYKRTIERTRHNRQTRLTLQKGIFGVHPHHYGRVRWLCWVLIQNSLLPCSLSPLLICLYCFKVDQEIGPSPTSSCPLPNISFSLSLSLSLFLSQHSGTKDLDRIVSKTSSSSSSSSSSSDNNNSRKNRGSCSNALYTNRRVFRGRPRIKTR